MKTKIMIVDDNILSLDSIYLSLKSHGFVVSTFSSPLKALSAFANERFDAVLSDYYMPEMRGDELLNKIKSIDPDVKTFLFSGYISSSIMENLDLEIAGTFLKKPLDITQIIMALED